jgi:PTH1 family peptidyl-tRNA hydrolase
LDRVAGRTGIAVGQKRFDALWGRGRFEGHDLLLVKPQTYMNLSGTSVRRFFDFFKLDPADLLVIHDEMDVAPGKLKVAARGSAGGHKGIESLIALLGFQDFARIRVGIGRPEPGRPSEPHVLGRFDADEWSLVEPALDQAAQAALMFPGKGVKGVQQVFNRKGNDRSEGQRSEREN